MEKVTDNKIIFSFEGGMADNHELNFYESARFQYAVARVLYKVENYRQTGKILSRVSEKIDADIRVKAAQEGSFELEILLKLLPSIELSLSVPLGVLFSYIFNSIKHKSKGYSVAERLSVIELKREQERTKQHQIENERIAMLMANKEKSHEPQVALTIINNFQFGDIQRELPDEIHDEAELDYIKAELEADIGFNEEIKPYGEALDDIPAKDLDELSNMFRQASKEIALPLRSSAETLSIKTSTDHKVCVFNKHALDGVNEEIVDTLPTYIEGSIKMYDKETGWGKFRNNGQFYKPIPFFVPVKLKNKILPQISKAFGNKVIGCTFYFVRNVYEEPIRLILDKISEVDTLE